MSFIFCILRLGSRNSPFFFQSLNNLVVLFRLKFFIFFLNLEPRNVHSIPTMVPSVLGEVEELPLTSFLYLTLFA